MYACNGDWRHECHPTTDPTSDANADWVKINDGIRVGETTRGELYKLLGKPQIRVEVKAAPCTSLQSWERKSSKGNETISALFDAHGKACGDHSYTKK
jgi:hypothetical protein